MGSVFTDGAGTRKSLVDIVLEEDIILVEEHFFVLKAIIGSGFTDGAGTRIIHS